MCIVALRTPENQRQHYSSRLSVIECLDFAQQKYSSLTIDHRLRTLGPRWGPEDIRYAPDASRGPGPRSA